MAGQLPTKEQVVVEVRELLARALGRVARDEAAGRLSPEHAAIVAQLRAKYGTPAAQQRPAEDQQASHRQAPPSRTHGCAFRSNCGMCPAP
jgi:hypothetical protein